MARHLYLHSAFFLGLVFPDWLAAGPIHDAAFFGKLDTIQTLLDKGPDIDERDSFDRTALHRATGKDSPKVAEFLISKGADLHAKDNQDSTPPQEAAIRDSADIAELLLAKRTDIFASASFISPVDHAGFFGKDGGKPILREFERHRLHYKLAHFATDSETAITPRLAKAKGGIIHGMLGKSYAIEYHTGANQ